MTVLHAEHVSYDIAGRSLVSDLNLVCTSGQFVALLGANGAGKSTLIHMLSGLERPSRGRVLLDDQPIRTIDRRTLARRRAYIPQNARVEWPVAVERLVALGLMPQIPVFGDLDSAAWHKVEAALAMCDLSHKVGQSATTLALAGEGRLIIASIHDLTLAARYATHVAVMRDGRLVAHGPTASTLTSECISEAFDIEACVHGIGVQATVDFIARPDRTGLHPSRDATPT